MKVTICAPRFAHVGADDLYNPRKKEAARAWTADIREVTGEEAPIAIIARPQAARLSEGKAADEVEYRVFEGRLWTRCKVAGARRQGANYALPAEQSILAIQGHHKRRSPPLRFDYLNESDTIVAIEAWAADGLYVDGAYHRVANEPHYLVATISPDELRGTYVTTCDDAEGYSHYKAQAFFGANELEMAEEWAARSAEARGDSVIRNAELRITLDVIDPTVLQMPKEFRIRKFVELTMQNGLDRAGGSRSPNDVQANKNYCLDALGQLNDMMSIDELEEASRRVMARWGSEFFYTNGDPVAASPRLFQVQPQLVPDEVPGVGSWRVVYGAESVCVVTIGDETIAHAIARSLNKERIWAVLEPFLLAKRIYTKLTTTAESE